MEILEAGSKRILKRSKKKEKIYGYFRLREMDTLLGTLRTGSKVKPQYTYLIYVETRWAKIRLTDYLVLKGFSVLVQSGEGKEGDRFPYYPACLVSGIREDDIREIPDFTEIRMCEDSHYFAEVRRYED